MRRYHVQARFCSLQSAQCEPPRYPDGLAQKLPAAGVVSTVRPVHRRRRTYWRNGGERGGLCFIESIPAQTFRLNRDVPMFGSIAPPLPASMNHPRRRGIRRKLCTARRAFSMIELVVVLLIIGILSAVAVPAFVDSLLFYRVESAARRVKADLELARQTARLTSTTQSIEFDDSTYSMSAGVVDLDHPTNAYFVDLAAAPYHLQTVEVDFDGGGRIFFDGYGAAADDGTIILTAADYECTVTLSSATGQITITRNHAGGLSTE
jgi:prepilin-type N-terminal cleavage/methylation domain-containing protein